MRITVFTPTYNRGYLIENLYRSLQRQTFRDFEWVVVDDGSTDDTEERFVSFAKEENTFPIRYIKTENGGKHRAINRGVQESSGELFFIVDSDDYLPDDALQLIDEVERTIPGAEKNTFGGVCGIKGFANEQEIGKTFEGEFLDITMLERSINGISGDKAEVFYTTLLRNYPFPEYDGENFITECVVWDKIAFDGYRLRFFNKTVMICEYRPDGLSAQGESLFYRNPKGWGLYLYQCVKYGKLNGLEKWSSYNKYYKIQEKQNNLFEISRNLHINPFVLGLRIFGLRVFYKLYDR